ncbi:hypothetical protein Mapa_011917 [Marchantia paleacea]|nr:hypothetical protein Mapa_011917 [Marchantia paleacea]
MNKENVDQLRRLNQGDGSLKRYRMKPSRHYKGALINSGGTYIVSTRRELVKNLVSAGTSLPKFLTIAHGTPEYIGNYLAP